MFPACPETPSVCDGGFSRSAEGWFAAGQRGLFCAAARWRIRIAVQESAHQRPRDGLRPGTEVVLHPGLWGWSANGLPW